jgi:hypothetical protein
MRKILDFFRHLSWPIALHVARVFLTIIGAVALMSFLLYSPWYARVLAALFLAGAWYSFYRLEWHWRYRRTLGRES